MGLTHCADPDGHDQAEIVTLDRDDLARVLAVDVERSADSLRVDGIVFALDHGHFADGARDGRVETMIILRC